MKRIFCLITLWLFSLMSLQGWNDQEAWAETKKSNNGRSSQGKIVALGDSLTAGLGVDPADSYPSLLQEKLKENGHHFRVINAGVSGETSSGTLSRLNWILSQEPDIVILEIGANDGLRGIDTGLVRRNIDMILNRLQQSGVVTVLAGMKMVRNLGAEYTRQFNDVYPALAGKYDIVFIPFFLEGVATDAKLNISDGIHPNEQGYRRIVDNIYPHIIEAIDRLNAGRNQG